MRRLLLTTLITSALAVPALAQVVPPAGPAAPAVVDSSIAHHDRAVARRAARHGHFRKAAHAANAANAAAADAAVTPH